MYSYRYVYTWFLVRSKHLRMHDRAAAINPCTKRPQSTFEKDVRNNNRQLLRTVVAFPGKIRVAHDFTVLLQMRDRKIVWSYYCQLLYASRISTDLVEGFTFRSRYTLSASARTLSVALRTPRRTTLKPLKQTILNTSNIVFSPSSVSCCDGMGFAGSSYRYHIKFRRTRHGRPGDNYRTTKLPALCCDIIQVVSGERALLCIFCIFQNFPKCLWAGNIGKKHLPIRVRGSGYRG